MASIPFHFNQEGLVIDCDDLIPLLSSTDEKLSYLAGSLIQRMKDIDALTPEQDELWVSKRGHYAEQCMANLSCFFGQEAEKNKGRVEETIEVVKERFKDRLENPTAGEKEKRVAEMIKPVITQLPELFKAVFSAFDYYNSTPPVASTEESTNPFPCVEGSV
jgi:hypothetical protein